MTKKPSAEAILEELRELITDHQQGFLEEGFQDNIKYMDSFNFARVVEELVSPGERTPHLDKYRALKLQIKAAAAARSTPADP